MNAAPATVGQAVSLLQVYVDYQHLLGGSRDYRRDRVRAAERFLDAHPDLDAWMARPLAARLVDLARWDMAWPLIGFAILTGRCKADADLLFAKNFGHTMARWTAGLFPTDIVRLTAAASRVGESELSTTELLRRALPMAVAFTGRPPSQLTVADLDDLNSAVAASQQLTPSMRRTWSKYVFALRRTLFEAGVIDSPALRHRGGGRATREARLAAVPAPEIRQTMSAYIDARSTVLRPKTIDKLTSALARGVNLAKHDQRRPAETTFGLDGLDRSGTTVRLALPPTEPRGCRWPSRQPRRARRTCPGTNPNTAGLLISSLRPSGARRWRARPR